MCWGKRDIIIIIAVNGADGRAAWSARWLQAGSAGLATCRSDRSGRQTTGSGKRLITMGSAMTQRGKCPNFYAIHSTAAERDKRLIQFDYRRLTRVAVMHPAVCRSVFSRQLTSDRSPTHRPLVGGTGKRAGSVINMERSNSHRLFNVTCHHEMSHIVPIKHSFVRCLCHKKVENVLYVMVQTARNGLNWLYSYGYFKSDTLHDDNNLRKSGK